MTNETATKHAEGLVENHLNLMGDILQNALTEMRDLEKGFAAARWTGAVEDHDVEYTLRDARRVFDTAMNLAANGQDSYLMRKYMLAVAADAAKK